MATDSSIRSTVRAGIAVGVASSAYGISFGALATASGLDVWQACVMSLLMFTGGSQFALIGVLASGGLAAGPSAIAGAALLGARNGIYGIRMKPVVAGHGFWQTFVAAWLTIDESTAVAVAQPDLRRQRVGFWTTGITIFILWNLTTLIGALIGDALGDIRQYGLDAAAPAAFLGLLWPRLRKLQPIAVAVGAAVVAVALTPVLPTGIPVLAAALVAVIVGLTNWLGRKDELAKLPEGESS